MRRSDREILEKVQLLSILNASDTCRLAFNTGTAPYIVPLNYGYCWNEDLEIYFHCAPEGRKLQLLKANNHVGFEIDTNHELVKGEKACNWGMKFKSIIGTGRLFEIHDLEKKIKYLTCIMEHYGFDGKAHFEQTILHKTIVLKLEVIELTGKVRK